MPETAEVYAHKLFAPRDQGGAIPRAALLDRVLGSDPRPTVLLLGPAGHGKTTLLQQIRAGCEQRGHATAWLTLDEADNDARRGFAHIQATLAQALGEAPLRSEADLSDTGMSRRRSDLVIDRLARAEGPISVFFDEFQAVQDPTLLHFFRNLLDRLPPHVRVFIGSRGVPEIGVSRLLLRNAALILRADDLRFSPAETADFFARTDLALTEAELAAIHTQTEGWPAALQLFRLSLASPEVRAQLGRLDAFRPRELAEYLVENVLSLQAPEVQEFLVRTSVLTRLSPALCDAVMGRTDSREMLQRLERSGLFLRPLDPQATWFRYHPLFSTFLAELLDARGAEAPLCVHRRASAWFRERGLLEEAAHHAVLAGDFGEAADAVALWAGRLIADGRLVTVERWHDRLPFEEVEKRPELSITCTYAMVFLRRFAKLKPLVEVLEARAATGSVARSTNPDIALSMAYIYVDDLPGALTAIERVDLRDPAQPAFASFEMGAGGNLAGFCALALNRFERAHELLALARIHSDRGAASFSSGYNTALMGAALIMEGQLHAALEVVRQGLACAQMQADGSYAAAALAACAIWAHYEADALDAAEALFARHRDAIANSVLLDWVAVSYFSAARLFDATARGSMANELLDEAERIGHANSWGRLVRMVQWERTRRHLAAGRTERGLTLARAIGAPSVWYDQGWRPFSEEVMGERAARIRLLIAAGETEEAGRLLGAELGRHKQRLSQQIRLLLLEALLFDRRGMPGPSRRSLRKALLLGQGARMIRCFTEEGEALTSLIADEYQGVMRDGAAASEVLGLEPGFLAGVLRAAGREAALPAPAGGAPAGEAALEALTEREREILALLASGASNRHMADRVFVSENTIKFHLKNIYGKLAVANRLQAVAAARRLRIVG